MAKKIANVPVPLYNSANNSEDGKTTSIMLSNSWGSSRSDIDLVSQKMLFMALSKMSAKDCPDEDGEIFGQVRVPLAGFCKASGVNKKYMSENGVSIASKTLTTQIYARNPNKPESWEIYNLFSKCRYEDGSLTLTLSKDLGPLLLGLHERGGYFKAVAGYVMQFRCKHTLKLYMLCQSRLFTGKPVAVPLEELRLMFLPASKGKKKSEREEREKYTSFKDFNARVLKPAAKELSEVTDLEVAMGYIYEGRKVAAVTFNTMKKPEAPLPAALPHPEGWQAAKSEEAKRPQKEGAGPPPVLPAAALAESELREHGQLTELLCSEADLALEAIKLLTSYDERAKEPGPGIAPYYGEKGMLAGYKLSVEILADMCCSPRPVKGERMTGLQFAGKLNELVRPPASGGIASMKTAFLDDAVKAMIAKDGKGEKISSKLAYLRKCLWDKLQTAALDKDLRDVAEEADDLFFWGN
jgi:hypothetical protein